MNPDDYRAPPDPAAASHRARAVLARAVYEAFRAPFPDIATVPWDHLSPATQDAWTQALHTMQCYAQGQPPRQEDDA